MRNFLKENGVTLGTIALVGLLALAVASLPGQAPLNAASPSVNSTVAIVDPYQPIQQAQVDTYGNFDVSTESLTPTYSYALSGTAPASTPTDWMVLCGATGHVIKLSQIIVNGLATTAGDIDVILYKRSTLPSSGTSKLITPAKMDVNDPSPSATLSLYTANPTVGTGIAFYAQKIQLGLTGIAANGANFIFGNDNSKAPTLRSRSDCVSVNLNGDSLPNGTALDATIRWKEPQ